MADPLPPRLSSPISFPLTVPPTVLFPLTVESDLCLTAQSVLRRECGADIVGIQLEPLPDRHQARLWICLSAAAYSVALHAVVLGLPGAEFGQVKMARPVPSVSRSHVA